MLVKKINPEWSPSENRGLKVGDTIEITDPTTLIKNGYAVAYDPKTGEEKGSWELYGVMSKEDKDEFAKFKEIKRQEDLKKKMESNLEEENSLNATLKARVAEVEKAKSVKKAGRPAKKK